jgi:hypothetical protein
MPLPPVFLNVGTIPNMEYEWKWAKLYAGPVKLVHVLTVSPPLVEDALG